MQKNLKEICHILVKATCNEYIQQYPKYKKITSEHFFK